MVKSFFITIFALLFSTCLFGQTPEDMIKNDWPNTFASFGKNSKNVPSHFIFVIDISDKNFGKDIVNQIGIFADALPKNDKITVIQLGPTDETKELVVTTDINEALLKEIKLKFQKLVTDNKFGTNGSDGLKMTKLIIKNLKSPGTAQLIPFVFVFSDLEYYPYNSFPARTEWMKLSNEFKSLKFISAPNIKTYLLANPAKSPRGDYKKYLNSIFPDMELGDVSGPQLLKQEFKLIQAEILRKKIINCVNAKASKQNATIQIENKNGIIELKEANSLVYHKLVLNEESEKKVAEILNSDKLFSFFPPSDTQIEVSGTLVAEKYKNELPELVDVPLTNQKITLMTADSLIPWWLTDIIVIILLLSIFRFIWTIIPVSLHGMISFSSLENFNAANNNTLCSGKKTVSIGVGHSIANDSSLFGNDFFSLSVTAKKAFFKGKCIELLPINGDLKGKKKGIIIQRKHKKLVDKNSFWLINGVTIGLPGVK